jgi:hypothetical protein
MAPRWQRQNEKTLPTDPACPGFGPRSAGTRRCPDQAAVDAPEYCDTLVPLWQNQGKRARYAAHVVAFRRASLRGARARGRPRLKGFAAPPVRQG